MTFPYSPTTALIVVDLQNDFVTGSLAVPGAESLIPDVVLEVRRARRAGAQIVFTQDWHPEQTPHYDEWPVHCVQGTEGAKLHPDIAFECLLSDYVVRKGQGQEDGYSAFEDPALPYILREARTAVVIGLAGGHCVASTAVDAALPHRYQDTTYGLEEVFMPLHLTRFVETNVDEIAEHVSRLVESGVRILP